MSAPRTIRSRRAVQVLVAALGCLLVLTGCDFHGAYDLPLPGKQVKGSAGYRVTADFNDVVNVVPRTLVMANDVPVGQVESVSRVGWHARVTMTVRKDIVLPKDATADVRQTSLLGEKYIALEAPAGSTVDKDGRLSDGDRIPLARTTRNPEVEEVLGALSMLLSGGGVGQLKTISSELNKMMDGRQADIRHLLGQLDTTVGSLDAQKQDIIGAMSAINTLTATLNREKRQIGAAIDSFGPALKVLNQQHRSLVKMLQSLDRLGVVGTRVLNASKDNIVASLRHLRPVLERLADAGDSLPRGLMMMASFPFPKEAADLAMGDYSNALFHMDFNLDKALKGLLGGTNMGLPELLQLCGTYTTNGTTGKASCDQLKPVFSALCSITHVEMVCSAAEGPGLTTKGTGVDEALKRAREQGSKLEASGSSVQTLIDSLLGSEVPPAAGSGTAPGSLSSLLGGLGLGSSGGLLGLLGGGGTP